jgi:hypothetical protein
MMVFVWVFLLSHLYFSVLFEFFITNVHFFKFKGWLNGKREGREGRKKGGREGERRGKGGMREGRKEERKEGRREGKKEGNIFKLVNPGVWKCETYILLFN